MVWRYISSRTARKSVLSDLPHCCLLSYSILTILVSSCPIALGHYCAGMKRRVRNLLPVSRWNLRVLWRVQTDWIFATRRVFPRTYYVNDVTILGKVQGKIPSYDRREPACPVYWKFLGNASFVLFLEIIISQHSGKTREGECGCFRRNWKRNSVIMIYRGVHAMRAMRNVSI